MAVTSLGWTVGAAAGNPHGTPPGQQKTDVSASTQASANGNANVNAGAKANAGAHGQAQAKGHVHAQASTQASAKTHGRARGHVHASGGSSVGAGAKAPVQVQAQAGVKPSSATSHWTVAAASSNQTKLYGNGTTAGQIATQAGAGASALYGPGNSQPHKVSCGAHMVDVHALKAHASGGVCGGTGATVRAHEHGHVGVGLSAKLSAAFAAAVGLGVKPFAGTGHNTVAAASSNQTKLYGNGSTAGQIAAEAGFGAATLYGPGNSQPHKVSCGAHMVDVHALKAKAGACVAAGAAGVAAQANGSAQASVQGSAAQTSSGQTQGATSAAQKSASAGKSGVQGARATTHAKTSSGGSGVLGAGAQLASVTKHASRAFVASAHRTLPFTGFGLGLPVALGLALIAFGYGLVRKSNSLS